MGSAGARRGGLVLAGALLAGYGGLVLVGVLAHESRPVAGLVLAAGLGLLALATRGDKTLGASEPHPPLEGRAWPLVFGGIGLAAAGGVLAHNVLAGSTLETPEVAILVYGVLLLAAAGSLDRTLGRARVGTLAAWSLPLAAAPLGVYALDAAIDSGSVGGGVGASPLDWFIAHGLVAPMGAFLDAVGFDVRVINQTVMMGTPRGRLALSVGLVCAGLQPGILFLGVFGLYAWQERTPPRRLAVLLALGLVGVYLANLVRLVVLALVGWRWGGAALQTTHAHAGWVLFVGFMLAYWWVVLRKLTPTRD